MHFVGSCLRPFQYVEKRVLATFEQILRFFLRGGRAWVTFEQAVKRHPARQFIPRFLGFEDLAQGQRILKSEVT